MTPWLFGCDKSHYYRLYFWHLYLQPAQETNESWKYKRANCVCWYYTKLYGRYAIPYQYDAIKRPWWDCQLLYVVVYREKYKGINENQRKAKGDESNRQQYNFEDWFDKNIKSHQSRGSEGKKFKSAAKFNPRDQLVSRPERKEGNDVVAEDAFHNMIRMTRIASSVAY